MSKWIQIANFMESTKIVALYFLDDNLSVIFDQVNIIY